MPAASPSTSSVARRARCSPSSPGVWTRASSISRQRLGRRAGGQPVGDQHHLRRHRAGDLGDHLRRHRHRGGARLAALAEVDGGLQRPHRGVGRGEGVGLDGGERRGVEVADLERELGQRPLALDVLRVLLDQAHQLVQRLAGLAAVAQQPGEGEPRRGMAVVEAEDVAELEPRPRLVAFGEQRQRPLVVRSRPARPGCRRRPAPAGRPAAGPARRGGRTDLAPEGRNKDLASEGRQDGGPEGRERARIGHSARGADAGRPPGRASIGPRGPGQKRRSRKLVGRRRPAGAAAQ